MSRPAPSLTQDPEATIGVPARAAGHAAPSALLALALCGLVGEAAWLGVLALGDLKRQVWTFELLFFAAFAAYLVACWLTLRTDDRRPTPDDRGAPAGARPSEIGSES